MDVSLVFYCNCYPVIRTVDSSNNIICRCFAAGFGSCGCCRLLTAANSTALPSSVDVVLGIVVLPLHRLRPKLPLFLNFDSLPYIFLAPFSEMTGLTDICPADLLPVPSVPSVATTANSSTLTPLAALSCCLPF